MKGVFRHVVRAGGLDMESCPEADQRGWKNKNKGKKKLVAVEGVPYVLRLRRKQVLTRVVVYMYSGTCTMTITGDHSK